MIRLLPAAALAALILFQTVQAQVPGVPPQALTIDAAVDLALERNLAISSAQSSTETSAIRVTTAFGEFLPTIRVTGNYSKQLNAGAAFLNGVELGSSRPDNTIQASAGASLLLFDGFRRTANYDAAQSTFSSQVQSLNRTRQEIAYQTRAAFLDVLRAEQIIEVRRGDLELANEQLARAQGLVDAGAAQIGSVYSQEAEVANAELSLEQATTDATVARNKLNLVLNIDPTQLVQLSSEGLVQRLDTLERARMRSQLGSINDLYKRQLDSRPDLTAARLKLEAASSNVSVARSGYYPSISSSLSWSWQRSAQDAGPLTSNSAQFGIDLQYTPFDGFRTGEQVELAEAQRQTAEIDLRRAELQARADLQQAITRLDGAERQLRAAEKAASAARQNRYSADERYKVGVGGYADYLLANNQYLTAQINQVNAVFNYRLAYYEIAYLVGE